MRDEMVVRVESSVRMCAGVVRFVLVVLRVRRVRVLGLCSCLCF
jgi:hypothetical protein